MYQIEHQAKSNSKLIKEAESKYKNDNNQNDRNQTKKDVHKSTSKLNLLNCLNSKLTRLYHPLHRRRKKLNNLSVFFADQLIYKLNQFINFIYLLLLNQFKQCPFINDQSNIDRFRLIRDAKDKELNLNSIYSRIKDKCNLNDYFKLCNRLNLIEILCKLFTSFNSSIKSSFKASSKFQKFNFILIQFWLFSHLHTANAVPRVVKIGKFSNSFSKNVASFCCLNLIIFFRFS